MKPQQLANAAFLACTMCASHAHAGLLGAEVTIVYGYPNPGSNYTDEGLGPYTATIGAGPEFYKANYYTIDFQDNRIVFDIYTTNWGTGVAHNGPRFHFDGVTIDSAAIDWSGTQQIGADTILTWTSSWIDIDWQYYDGLRLVVDVESTRVPEPATLALLAAGMAGAGLVRRRSRRA